MSKENEKYPVDEDFADALAVACSQSRKVWGRIGKDLEPDCMPGDFAPRVFKAVSAITRDLGHGPDSSVLVVQRIRRWVEEGSTTHEQLEAVVERFDAVEDAGLPDPEALVQEVVPILRRRMERAALDLGFTAFQKRRGLEQAAGLIERAQRLGDVDTDLGTLLGPASFSEMERLKQIERLPTGILELDDALVGGPYRGTLSCFMSDTGGGKSMGLIQVAANAALEGHHACLATLELPKEMVLARLKANLTGIPIDRVLADPRGSGAIDKLAEVQANGFGSIIVKDFSPSTTTIPDITAWVTDWEREHEIEVSLLAVDYADKCVSHERKKDDGSTYTTGKVVYERLRLWAYDNKRWSWTASADKGQSRDKKVKRTDTGDVADSKHKVRVSDLWVTLNPREELDSGDAMLEYFIAKNRLGRARFTVGPMPTDWACARIVTAD